MDDVENIFFFDADEYKGKKYEEGRLLFEGELNEGKYWTGKKI